jgi:hypothetical protein
MSEKIDKEIDAIKTVLTCLDELEVDVRKSVLQYVLKRLNLTSTDIFDTNESRNPDDRTRDSEISVNSGKQKSDIEGQSIHIKEFMEQKKPKSANEMTALIAYYLLNLAEPGERKQKIKAADLETWFKISDFNPFPTGGMRNIINNAKNAGYLDSVGEGDFKLNAVGYNLIKHSLPRKDK